MKDRLEESTIELFRHYLREVLRGRRRDVSAVLGWADN